MQLFFSGLAVWMEEFPDDSLRVSGERKKDRERERGREEKDGRKEEKEERGKEEREEKNENLELIRTCFHVCRLRKIIPST